MAEIFTLQPPTGPLTFDEAREHADWIERVGAAARDDAARMAAREARLVREAQARQVMLDTAAGNAAFQHKLDALRLRAHESSSLRQGFRAGFTRAIQARDYLAAAAGACIGAGLMLALHAAARLGWLLP